MSDVNNTNDRSLDDLDDQQNKTDSEEYVTALIDGQLFGIPVLSVQDVLGPQTLANIPLAPPEVAGSLNLRGRIVTAIDLRKRLGMDPADREKSMSIVVDHHGELYSLLIDEVGEVLQVPMQNYERNPATLDPRWRDVSQGIFRLDGRLLVILQVQRLLDIIKVAAAA
ncbi:MAG: chemotaxis protein CheW [Rhodospirillaceae bacterium]|jgi:purine-binding chemotaxis protein CheW|nr:chemotaxis protein CheW [Rhodospirillaceae bacterium]MBT3490668.1 chemotaxis protein CheW [Rhodospirillaceae bacterium]MBT3781662.1 chemotaxis protein CheW [Rhodospirillaceae bacterium]MBT3978455.1 chemotaxis protein CheW [Rhodospirillaceae bacterium]MBT4564077.1 chemotaxis protein CheW [Rhodospirillaceae bacterium]